MEVILLTDVDKVGLRGEVVNVARGYARNYLLPRKLAEPATSGRVAELRRIDEQRARHEARTLEQANEIADVLRKTVLTFDVKSGPTGALFGSVTTTDIADELWRTRKIRVDRKKIGTDSIRRIGRYAIPIQVFEDVTAEVKTLVVPEGGELPPEEELAALEAAEAAAEAEHVAEVETVHAEAETAIAEAIAEDEPEAEEDDGETSEPQPEGETSVPQPEDEASEPQKQQAKSAYNTCLGYSVKYQYFDEFSRNCEVWLAENYKSEFHEPFHSPVERSGNFPHDAHVSGWKTSPLVFAGRPEPGITCEHMFRCPCIGGQPPYAWTSRPRTG